MSYSQKTFNKGEIIHAADMTDLSAEVFRLNQVKLDQGPDGSVAITGKLSVTGNVGIGTSTPQTALQVAGTVKSSKFGFENPAMLSTDHLTGDDVNTDYLNLSMESIPIPIVDADVPRYLFRIGHIENPNSPGGSLGSFVPKLSIDQDGSVLIPKRVGIGTNNPQTALDVNGDLSVSGHLSFGATTRQMINLYNTDYGIGIQDNAIYARTENNFAIFKGGEHSQGTFDPGVGGTMLMGVNYAGDLILPARSNPNGTNGKQCRALVNFDSDQLYVNFGNDFAGGTVVDSDLKVTGKIGFTNSSPTISTYATNAGFGSLLSLDVTLYSSTFSFFTSNQFRVLNTFYNYFTNSQSETSLFIVDQNGNAHAHGTFTNGSCDYAELFESETGSAIPVGTAVTFGKNGKIHAALAEEIPIGIITNTPGILGNNPMEWPQKFLLDDFGNKVMEQFEEDAPISMEAAEEWGEMIKSGKSPTAKDKKRLLTRVKVDRPKLNPKYDPQKSFVLRSERPEWQTVGIMGQLRMQKGQPTGPGWVKISDISDKVELWLVK